MWNKKMECNCEGLEAKAAHFEVRLIEKNCKATMGVGFEVIKVISASR
jgi:hypothetical protein